MVETTETTPMLVICRHKHTIRLLKELNIISDTDTILTHVSSVDQIKDKIVLGTLPIDLAAHCKLIYFIKWNIPEEYRGKDWTYEETWRFYDGIGVYQILQLETVKKYTPSLDEA